VLPAAYPFQETSLNSYQQNKILQFLKKRNSVCVGEIINKRRAGKYCVEVSVCLRRGEASANFDVNNNMISTSTTQTQLSHVPFPHSRKVKVKVNVDLYSALS